MATSFNQLEIDFQRNLNDYKTTYKEYLLLLNNQNDAYWKTQENVTVENNLHGAIPFLTDTDISKEKCLHACSSDKNCNYVLFSDSGNGECAANQCLKWTSAAGSIIKNTSSGNMIENKACVAGKGPSHTNYVYSGWEKPQWKDSANISFMGAPIDLTKWNYLGTTNNMIACKDMSTASNDGPFSSVVFLSKEQQCYGGAPDAPHSMNHMDGAVSSVSPIGLTNKTMMTYVKKLKTMNADLKQNLTTMTNIVNNETASDINDPVIIKKTKENIKLDYMKLNNDDAKLDKLTTELETLDVKLGMLNKLTSRDKKKYVAMAIFLLLLSLLFFLL